MTRRRIGIIGGGITGLMAAYRLSQAGVDVVIYEASGDLGGLASGLSLAGHPVEKAYHFLYKTDEYILGLVNELGFNDKLTFHKSSVSTYYDGVLYPMMTPVDLIKFKPISFINRIRAGVSVLYLQRVKNWRALSKIAALEWLRRYAGKQVTDVIWEPLLRGKFDRYYDKVTMSWLWGRVKQRVDSRDAKLGGEALGYFDGGFKIIIDALAERVRAAGVEIRLNTKVASLKHDGAHVVVTTDAGEERFDRVLATTPSNVTAALIKDYESVDPGYFQRLRSIDYLDACVHVFATPQKFTPYYWHNINTRNAPFVVFLSLTNLVGSERYGGLNIYYIGDYVPAEHRYMSMDAAELKQLWYGELKKIFPEFDPSKVVEDAVFRLRNAQHIVDIGFEENKLLPHETPCPGVIMCNFSQIYPMDRGTNYAVRDGDRMAKKLLAELAGQPERDSGPLLTTPAPGERARKRMPAALLWLVAGLAAFGALGLAAFAGFEVATRELPGRGLLVKADTLLERVLGRDEPVDTSVTTNLLRLDTSVGRIPVAAAAEGTPPEQVGGGGGLTVFGGEVLVLPFDGRIYAARSAAEIRATRVQGPERNLADYWRVADDPALSERYTFNRGFLRYNDVLYYDSRAGHGLLASYVEFHADRLCYNNAVAQLALPADAQSIDTVEAGPEDWRVVYRTQPCLPLKEQHLALEGHMAGGRLAFAAPSTIYMTSGDFHLDGMRSDGPPIAQDPTAEYGKVLRIDLITGEGAIVSMGHRNMQGIARLDDGRVLVIEHGPRGGDELNLIREGANYGWPRVSYGTTYASLHLPGSESYGRHERYEAPLHAWVPSAAVSGVTLIEGFDPAWDGDLLASSLAGQSLFRLRLQDGRVIYSEQIPMGFRMRDVESVGDGRIAVLREDYQLSFLTVSRRATEQQHVASFIANADMSDAMRARVSETIEMCTECHALAADDNSRAPSLGRVFESDIASTDFPYYSDALRRADGRWTREALRAYLDDPQAFAPGTAMPDPNLDDPELTDETIRVLEEMKTWF